MKQSIRAFGIGLFIAGALFTFLGSKLDDTAKSEDVSSYKEQIKELEQQLTAATTVEADNVPANTKPKDNKTVASPADTVVTNENDSDIITGTVYVYEGMSLYDIGKQVEDIGVVENGREVELYLSKPEYSRSIQKGVFDLHSDMTIEEISKTLTGKKIAE